jgi:hypothetical protein
MENMESSPTGKPALSSESFPVLDSESSPIINMSSSDDEADAILFGSGLSKVAHGSNSEDSN